MSAAGSRRPTILEAEGVVRRFGHLTAVDGVDIAIGRGEVFGFLGPNGAGKSTLLRMLVGLMAPSWGRVTVLGLEMPRQAEDLRARIGYMPQHFALYEDLSVLENLEFAAAIFGLEPRQQRARVGVTLERYGLEARAEQRAGTLSGGWKQRLALAAATIHEPEILVLDEPTAGVDPENRRVFWEMLFELASEGATVLVSTHYMDEAVRCHRLCLLRRGRRVALGGPMELAAVLRGRVVEVRAPRPEAAVAALRATGRITSVTQLGDLVHVLLLPDSPQAEEVAPELAQALAEAGITGAAVVPAAPNLEDVFVAATLGESFPGMAGDR